MVLCSRLDVKPIIVLNLCTGSPSESAEWVRYVKEKGYKVFGWELGNELYLPFFKNKIRDGDGKAFPQLAAFVEKNSLNHVKFLGFKRGRELDELIRNSICTIVPSEWFETFGLTIIESFARGRPVIASSIGGMTEVVSDSVDGSLVPPGNVSALREQMNWMLSHRNKAVEMGTAGRKKAETDYSADIHYEKITMVYKKVLSYGKRPALSIG